MCALTITSEVAMDGLRVCVGVCILPYRQNKISQVEVCVCVYVVVLPTVRSLEKYEK